MILSCGENNILVYPALNKCLCLNIPFVLALPYLHPTVILTINNLSISKSLPDKSTRELKRITVFVRSGLRSLAKATDNLIRNCQVKAILSRCPIVNQDTTPLGQYIDSLYTTYINSYIYVQRHKTHPNFLKIFSMIKLMVCLLGQAFSYACNPPRPKAQHYKKKILPSYCPHALFHHYNRNVPLSSFTITTTVPLFCHLIICLPSWSQGYQWPLWTLNSSVL